MNNLVKIIPATLQRVAGNSIKFIYILIFICLGNSFILFASDTSDYKQITVSYEGVLSKNISHTHIKQGPVTEYQGSLSPGLGLGCKFSYNLSNKLALKGGLEVGAKTYVFTFDLPANKYNLQWNYTDKKRIFGGYVTIPIKIGYISQISHNYKFSFYSGVYVSSFLRGSFGTTGYMMNKENILKIKGDYQPDYQKGYTFSAGINKQLNNNHVLSLTLLFRQCFSEIFAVDYTFFPEIDKYKTTGKWYTKGGFIGLKIGYLIY